METIQETEMENDIAVKHLPTEGGQNPPPKCSDNSLKIKLFCQDCGEEIKDWRRYTKKFCSDCFKKKYSRTTKQNREQANIWNDEHREKRRRWNREWKKNYPKKYNKYMRQYYQNNLEERRKYLKEYFREYRKKKGAESRWSITNCTLCGKDISNLNPNCIYCMECNEEIRNLYRRWFKKEQLGIDFEKRAFINNCVICGQDISIYPSNSKLCSNCVEKNLPYLGTTNFSSHMRRKKYNIPDWRREQKAIDIQMKICGLK